MITEISTLNGYSRCRSWSVFSTRPWSEEYRSLVLDWLELNQSDSLLAAHGAESRTTVLELIEPVAVKWDIEEVSIVHRVGHLDIGDVAVSIAVTAAHRAPALEACRYVIDRLKEDVPIWKREQGANGETWWGKGP